VAFADGVLTITVPEGSYQNGCRYCLVIGQTIPETTTINAAVQIAIGDGAVTYPVTRCNGVPVTAAALRTRTIYPVVVSTNATGGVFRVMKNLCCAPVNQLDALTGDAPTSEGGAA
jgi:hypothetical protein